jgi:DNA gyrase/topoisomerase IV subunit A
MGMDLANHHRMAAEETVCRIASWTQIKRKERLLIVTIRGFARAFPLNILRSNVEAPIPLKLDDRLFGVPVGLAGVDSQDEFVLVTRNGRGLRWPIHRLKIAGTQVANCGKEDQVTDIAIADSEHELILLTNDGYGRKLSVKWIPVPPGPNKSGRSLIARRSELVAVARSSDHVLTNKHVRVPDLSDLPTVDSTKSKRILKLEPLEFVVGTFSGLLGLP